MKCDEAEPNCKRCTSTGRKCDGYIKSQVGVQFHESGPLSTTGSSSDENRAFAFFRRMAGPALSGHFESYFWTNVVMQLSHREPAVRHALLAISSLYERFQDMAKTPALAPTDLFAVRQYNAAIKELRSARDETVVLVVCALFICVEFLQGNHQAAVEHCRSGIQVLNSASPSSVWARDQLLAIFCRIGILPFFFGCTASSFPCVAGLDPKSSTRFCSITDAQSSLDVMLSASIRFVRHSDTYRLGWLRYTTIPTSMREKQNSLVTALNEWQCAFTDFRTTQPQSNSNSTRCCLLQMKSSVVQIWVTVALEKSETAYDQHVDKFQSIIDLASQAALSRPHTRDNARRPSFIFEMGFTPLLYFVAMKCRYLSIRLAALSLMTTLGASRETLWDLSTMYRVAQRLIEIEHEIDLHKVTVDGPGHPQVPSEEKRVREVMLGDIETRQDDHGYKHIWTEMRCILWSPVNELATQSEWITLS